jgi:hypothetical protein
MWKATSSPPPGEEPTPAPKGHAHTRTLSVKLKNPGRWFGQVVKLKKDRVEEYKACHAKIWPEVAKQIKDCGIEDCKLTFFCVAIS